MCCKSRKHSLTACFSLSNSTVCFTFNDVCFNLLHPLNLSCLNRSIVDGSKLENNWNMQQEKTLGSHVL